MTVRSGFFNSSNGDRVYDADDINNFFEGLLSDGVFATIGESFIVKESTGLTLIVPPGKAWFQKSWLENTSDYLVTHSPGNQTFGRMDAIYLEFNKRSLRKNSIGVSEGEPAEFPPMPILINSPELEVIQIPIAYIYVGPGATTITQSDIINKVGSDDCPFITGVLETVSAEDAIAQWEAQFNQWLISIEDDIAAIDSGEVFNELADMRERPHYRKNLLINGGFEVNQRIEKTVVDWDGDPRERYAGIADRWGFVTTAPVGEWTITTWDKQPGRALRVECTQAQFSSLAADSMFRVSQIIECSNLASLYKGTSEAKDMVLSFNFRTNMANKFVVEVHDRVNDWSISQTFQVSQLFLWKEYEFVIPKETTQYIPNSNESGLEVSFWLVAGTDYTSGGSLQTTWGPITTNKRAYGQSNLAAAVGMYAELNDVQLEVGSVKTDFERTPYHETEMLCKRYMEWYDIWQFMGVSLIYEQYDIYCYGRNYAVRKRAQPTITFDIAKLMKNGDSWYFMTDLVNMHEINEDIFGQGSGEKEQYPSITFNVMEAIPSTGGNAYRCLISDMMISAELF